MSDLPDMPTTDTETNVATEPSQEPSISAMDRQFSLAELLDLGSFREVMKSFADLYRIGVRVFDIDGRLLCDIRVASSTFYAYLFEFGSTRKKTTSFIDTLKRDPFPQKNGIELPRLVKDLAGMSYVVMPILHDGDLLGRLIFGPYRATDHTGVPESLFELEPELDREKIKGLAEAIRQAPNDIVAKVLRQLQKVIEVILFTSFRGMMTNKMHIEAITTSYTELQEKQGALREANERLQELDKMKSNFLATVSHELRTPLTSVIGYSEMLLEGLAGDLNPEQHEYVTTIMQKGETLLGLISQILDISRIESGHLRMERQEFAIVEVLEQATTSVLPQALKQKIQLDIQIANDVPLFFGDKDKVRQIIVNLLGNAVKFTPESGTITLSADRFVGSRRDHPGASDSDYGATDLFALDDEDFIRIAVTDSGIGIPSEKLARVFDRFYQVDNSSTREYGGTGLGLSIVKSFVDAHEGEIWAESETGEGTRFTILLPLTTS